MFHIGITGPLTFNTRPHITDGGHHDYVVLEVSGEGLTGYVGIHLDSIEEAEALVSAAKDAVRSLVRPTEGLPRTRGFRSAGE